MEMNFNSRMVRVADWSDEFGLAPMKPNKSDERLRPHIEYERNRTYIVTSILEEPYLMQRKGKTSRNFENNELYEGYCKDLADLLAAKLGINCML